MFILGNFFFGVAQVLGVVLNLLTWLIVIRALLSWVNPDPSNPIVQFIERVTEPILVPFRRLVPSYKMGIDLSPLLAILFIIFLQHFLVPTLYQIGYRFR